jgi:hypothetical protein
VLHRRRLALLALAAVARSASACSSDAPSSDPAGASAATASPPRVACAPSSPLAEPTESFFADISESSGIRKGNFVANPPKPIPINDHSRLAFVDIDGDGLDDVVAHSLFPNPQAGVPFEHLVFKNEGDKTFADVSAESGLRDVQAAFFAFADVDGDGDQDCFAGLDIDLPGETSAIYLNDGKGHFTKKAGSGVEVAALTANAVFGDFDGDGKLDLYAGNGGTTAAALDQLFLGNGDGTFRDASKNLRARPAQPTNGVVACDYDDDGDLDVLVSHYGVSIGLGWRTLWENDGHGVFTDVAKARGFHALATGNSELASTGHGRDPQPGDPSKWVGSNGFGIDCQDVDGDGHMDVWLAAISHPVDADESRKWSDPSQLFLNEGPDRGFSFVAATLDRGIPFNEGDIDAAAIDFDNDGRVDLSVSRDKKYEGGYSKPDQKAWFGLFRQRGDGRFASVGLASGINDPSGRTDRAKAGQNLAWSDIDGDGDLDLLLGGRDNGGGGRANFLFENTIGQKNGWVGVRLRGDGAAVNRDAIGARVTLTVGERRIVREVKSSRGTYSSADMRALLFGLGEEGCSAEGQSRVAMDVRWPDGRVDRFDPGSFPLGRYLVVEYGKGVVPSR